MLKSQSKVNLVFIQPVKDEFDINTHEWASNILTVDPQITVKIILTTYFKIIL